jgi:hypothetical protein
MERPEYRIKLSPVTEAQPREAIALRGGRQQMTSPSQVIRFKGPFCRATQSDATHGFLRLLRHYPVRHARLSFLERSPLHR